MKAQTFLEWFNKLSTPFQVTNLPNNIHGITDIYSQPFKPEMITECFEGIVDAEKTAGGKEGFVVESTVYKIIHLPNPCEYLVFLDYEDGFLKAYHNNPPPPIPKFIILDNQKKRLWETRHPNTLNDFISDCNRAGIELTWKPEIEKRFQ